MASTYLSRTPSSATNRKTWTLSFWFKRSKLGLLQVPFSAYTNTSNLFWIYFDPDDNINFIDYASASANLQIELTRKFRDTSAWYHIVLAVDTTQATASNRVKIYINSELQNSFLTETYPSQNYDTFVNTTIAHYIGRYDGSVGYYDGQMTHVHFIDGTAYTPSAFGETDATTGIWKPKTAPSVTYGTNGFFLKFENSGAFGTDSSGNSNTFTVNGTMTQTLDTPSNVFATFNPLQIPNNGAAGGLSNGNLTITSSGGQQNSSTLFSSIDTNAKWYYEAKLVSGAASTDNIAIGWSTEKNVKQGGTTWATANTLYIYSTPGNIFSGSGSWSNGVASTYTNGDIIGCALDLENNTVKWYKNGTLEYTVSSITPSGDYIFPWIQNNNSGTVMSANFGNGYFGTAQVASAENPDDGIGIFEYSVPTGYRALCTKSINAEEYS